MRLRVIDLLVVGTLLRKQITWQRPGGTDDEARDFAFTRELKATEQRPQPNHEFPVTKERQPQSWTPLSPKMRKISVCYFLSDKSEVEACGEGIYYPKPHADQSRGA